MFLFILVLNFLKWPLGEGVGEGEGGGGFPHSFWPSFYRCLLSREGRRAKSRKIKKFKNNEKNINFLPPPPPVQNIDVT
jgi:hypothetical protein